jgi:hypothetical protein
VFWVPAELPDRMTRPVSATAGKHGIQKKQDSVLTGLANKTLLLENLNPDKSCTYRK